MTRPGFLDQIAKAKAEVRKMKRTMPHIFPQWQALKHAEDDLAKAKANLKAAKEAWNKVGST